MCFASAEADTRESKWLQLGILFVSVRKTSCPGGTRWLCGRARLWLCEPSQGRHGFKPRQQVCLTRRRELCWKGNFLGLSFNSLSLFPSLREALRAPYSKCAFASDKASRPHPPRGDCHADSPQGPAVTGP